MNVTAWKGVQFKVLGGLQRRYWDWKHGAWVGGADLEMNLEQYSSKMRDKGITWMVGASGVLKQEGDEDIIVSGTNYRLDLPTTVGAFDVRSRFQKETIVCWPSMPGKARILLSITDIFTTVVMP